MASSLDLHSDTQKFAAKPFELAIGVRVKQICSTFQFNLGANARHGPAEQCGETIGRGLGGK